MKKNVITMSIDLLKNDGMSATCKPWEWLWSWKIKSNMKLFSNCIKRRNLLVKNNSRWTKNIKEYYVSISEFMGF